MHNVVHSPPNVAVINFLNCFRLEYKVNQLLYYSPNVGNVIADMVSSRGAYLP